MIRVNFKFPEIFEHKFGRKPKMWTITQLHELYLKSKERYDSHYDNLMETLDKISKLEKNSSDKIVTPFKQVVKRDKKDKSGNLISIEYETYNRQYEFSEHRYYGDKSLGWSISDDKENLKNRTNKLDFLTLAHQEELSEILGQEFHDRQVKSDAARRSMYKVYEILWDEVGKKLCEEYKGKQPPKISVVKIQGIEYYFECESSYSSNYHNFKYIEKKSDKILEL